MTKWERERKCDPKEMEENMEWWSDVRWCVKNNRWHSGNSGVCEN